MFRNDLPTETGLQSFYLGQFVGDQETDKVYEVVDKLNFNIDLIDGKIAEHIVIKAKMDVLTAQGLTVGFINGGVS